MGLDLVVRNGVLIDGTGSPGVRADVGVSEGRIVEIGKVEGRGDSEIDAEGCVVTPGFIDGHTHMDAQIHWDPLGTSSCWHGVTSVVMGNCGFTLAPVRADGHHLVTRNLERAEDIAAEALAAGVEWSWEGFPEYLDVLDSLPKGINYAANIGHSALRTWAMGDRAFEGESGDDDIALMEQQLRDALAAGAVGLTTSRSENHETSGGSPVASRLASWAEVQQLVGIVGETGTGMFELSVDAAARSDDPSVREQWNKQLGDLAVTSGATVTFGVVPTKPGCEDAREQLQLMERTIAAGGRMFGQAHSRGISTILSFEAQLPFDRLEHWREIRQLPLEEQRSFYMDPTVRARLIDSAYKSDHGRAIGTEPRKADFERMRLLDSGLPPHETVGEVARRRGVDPVELMIDLALETNFKQLFMQAFTVTDSAALLEVMRSPHTVMTFSDSGAHVGQISDASIQTHLLGHWVRNEQAFTLEEGVRMITAEPAIAWGFTERGLVRSGYVADLNVFDPDTVAPAVPEVRTDLPAKARRFIQHAEGFRATVVGGEILFRDGIHTGALPGRLLRRGGQRRSAQ
jgi:N-acyl-D-aspartate/D-glutamate deacylase